MTLFKRIIKTSFLSVLFLFMSCSQPEEQSIEGLWLVYQVRVGAQIDTPSARWIRFEPNNKQTSGNGWLQHSYGNWSLKGTQILISDSNGIKDQSGSFAFSIDKDQMKWTRKENGKEATLLLKRIEKLPQSDGDKLLGLWKLTKANSKGNDITNVLNADKKAMLQLRWDHTFVELNMPKGRRVGMYRFDPIKSEIQLVNYGSEPRFSSWKFEISTSKLKLISPNKKSFMEFERIYQFLQ